MSELDHLIYDWNRDGRAIKADYRAVELDDETLRARLGKAGRQEAQLYGWSSVTEAVLDIYAGVLGSKKTK